MSWKTIEIVESFDPNKKYKIPIRKQIFKVLSELEKGNQYQLSELIESCDGIITKKKESRPRWINFPFGIPLKL